MKKHRNAQYQPTRQKHLRQRPILRGADRKQPDPLARTSFPDSGSRKSGRSRCARRVAGFHPAPKRLRPSAPRRSRCSSPPRGQRTGVFSRTRRPSGRESRACSRWIGVESREFEATQRPVVQQQHDERPRHQHRLAQQAQKIEKEYEPVVPRGESESGEPRLPLRLPIISQPVPARSGRRKQARELGDRGIAPAGLVRRELGRLRDLLEPLGIVEVGALDRASAARGRWRRSPCARPPRARACGPSSRPSARAKGSARSLPSWRVIMRARLAGEQRPHRAARRGRACTRGRTRSAPRSAARSRCPCRRLELDAARARGSRRRPFAARLPSGTSASRTWPCSSRSASFMPRARPGRSAPRCPRRARRRRCRGPRRGASRSRPRASRATSLEPDRSRPGTPRGSASSVAPAAFAAPSAR